MKAFEEDLAKYSGAKYCVAFCNGTAALHAGLWAMGVKEGDKVVTTPLTFAASANAAVYVGALPQFVDIDPNTLHLDIKLLNLSLRIQSGARL